jgi:hypothetical protein
VGLHGSVGSYAIDGAVVARGDVEESVGVDGEAGGIHHLGDVGLDVVTGVDLIDSDGNFLSACAGEGAVDVSFGVDCGIGDGMEIVGNGQSHADLLRIAAGAVGGDSDGARGRAFGDTCDNEFVGADDNTAVNFTEGDARPTKFLWAKMTAEDTDFSAGKSECGFDGLNLRIAVGRSHQLFEKIPQRLKPHTGNRSMARLKPRPFKATFNLRTLDGFQSLRCENRNCRCYQPNFQLMNCMMIRA